MRLAIPSGNSTGPLPGVNATKLWDPSAPDSDASSVPHAAGGQRETGAGWAPPPRGGQRNTVQGCPPRRFPGRTSAARTQTSPVNPGSTTKCWYSMTPSAGTANSAGVRNTASGVPIAQPVVGADVGGGTPG